MKEIELPYNMIVFVDDEDYNNLINYKWYISRTSNNVHYACRSLEIVGCGRKRYQTISMHCDIIHPQKGLVVDHIDGNGLNNQKSNLRAVTIRQNLLNRHTPMKYNYHGIHQSTNGLWKAHITIGGIKRFLGTFLNPQEAENEYMKYVRVADYAIMHKVKECCYA